MASQKDQSSPDNVSADTTNTADTSRDTALHHENHESDGDHGKKDPKQDSRKKKKKSKTLKVFVNLLALLFFLTLVFFAFLFFDAAFRAKVEITLGHDFFVHAQHTLKTHTEPQNNNTLIIQKNTHRATRTPISSSATVRTNNSLANTHNQEDSFQVPPSPRHHEDTDETVNEEGEIQQNQEDTSSANGVDAEKNSYTSTDAETNATATSTPIASGSLAPQKKRGGSVSSSLTSSMTALISQLQALKQDLQTQRSALALLQAQETRNREDFNHRLSILREHLAFEEQLLKQQTISLQQQGAILANQKTYHQRLFYRSLLAFYLAQASATSFPFEREVNQLAQNGINNAMLSALNVYAKTGVPSLWALSETLQTLSRTPADTTKDAPLMDKAKDAPHSQDTITRFLKRFGILTVTKKDEPKKQNALLHVNQRDELERALFAHDADALRALEQSLPNATQYKMQAWFKSAEQRLHLDFLVRTLALKIFSSTEKQALAQQNLQPTHQENVGGEDDVANSSPSPITPNSTPQEGD